MSLTKQQILAADDCKRERLEVPEWADPTSDDEADRKGEVWIRVMYGEERDMFEAEIYGFANRNGTPSKMSFRNVRAKLGALVLCDKSGTRLFTDADVAVLGKKSGIALDRVLEAARRLNAMMDADVEDLAKNSESGQRG